MVVPDEGEINYDKCTGKNAHKFVEKIINAEVDLYEIQEKPLKKKKKLPPKHPIEKPTPKSSKILPGHGDL